MGQFSTTSQVIAHPFSPGLTHMPIVFGWQFVTLLTPIVASWAIIYNMEDTLLGFILNDNLKINIGGRGVGQSVW